MHLDPKCKNLKHKCLRLCTSEDCGLPNPFVCETCGNHHKKECELTDYSEVVRKLHRLQGINRKDLNRYEEEVEVTFRTMIKSLQAEFLNFREHFERINASNRIM
jgi:esterase/lipase